MRKFIVLGFVMALLGMSLATVSAQEGDAAESDGVILAIYNQGTALVRDRRTFDLSEGVNTVNFTDVASGIDPTSVSFTSLTDPEGTTVLEQNYVYDLVDSSALPAATLTRRSPSSPTMARASPGQLLSGRSEIILRQEDGQVVVISPTQVRDIRFPDLPGGLITRPTLRWLVQSGASGPQQVELTYLTGGMNWSADYILLLNNDNSALDLNGWITLNNTSGTSYTDALVKLVAGDVNRLPQPVAMEEREVMMDAMTAAPAAPPVAQREFYEYQLYEITRPVTVADNETKQVEFVSGSNVPAHTFYVYDGSQPYYFYGSPITDPGYGNTGITDVQNYLEFTTDEDSGLGADLPAGRVRVYQEDVDGAALLIGENSIDHTPEGEQVELYLGNAFDLVGERTQTNYNQLASNILEETYEIHLRNRKDDQAVEIRVPEHLFRWSNWEILDASHEYAQTDSSTIEFRVTVPPDGEEVITYTVRYTWPQ